MVSTIEELALRLDTLESQIQSLSKKSKQPSAFNNFTQCFTPHVRSALFNKNFVRTHNLHFKPTHSQIIKEISLMWNALAPDEKLHFTYTMP